MIDQDLEHFYITGTGIGTGTAAACFSLINGRKLLQIYEIDTKIMSTAFVSTLYLLLLLARILPSTRLLHLA
jgi:hypothetical protein